MRKNSVTLNIIIVFFFASSLVIPIGFYYYNFVSTGISQNTANWGAFGDFIGGVIGTIFNLIGVFLIYWTFKRQESNSNLQQFETTFFNMLTNQRDITKQLSSSKNFPKMDGAEFLSYFSENLKKDIESCPKEPFGIKEQQEFIQEIYDKTYLKQASVLGHYFRHLYHIVKYTDESFIPNKKKYIDIIQSQMSDDELYCNFYNSISKYGKEKFLPLLSKYYFFENISSRNEIFDIHKNLFYPNTVFKDTFSYKPLGDIDD